jgi:hypothetical protein
LHDHAGRYPDATPPRLALLAALVLVLGVACAPPVGKAPASFVGWLDDYGQQFVPVANPAGTVVAPDVVLQTLEEDGFPPFATDRTADAPILGVAQCGPGKCRLDRGLLAEGRDRLWWVVGFPNASGGNGGTAWAAVDARTGAFVVGDGPPGP